MRFLIGILLLGFHAEFVIITQSQALAQDTLNSPLSTSNNANGSIITDNEAQSFHIDYEMLINDSHILTQSYQKEIGKWQSKQYDNKTMISITDKYLPEFQKLVNRAQALQPTTANYLQARDLYIKSLQSEIGSYMHFRYFLATGTKVEDNISTQLLSNALKYEIKSFNAFNNRTVTDMDNNNNYGNETISSACENNQSPYTCV